MSFKHFLFLTIIPILLSGCNASSDTSEETPSELEKFFIKSSTYQGEDDSGNLIYYFMKISAESNFTQIHQFTFNIVSKIASTTSVYRSTTTDGIKYEYFGRVNFYADHFKTGRFFAQYSETRDDAEPYYLVEYTNAAFTDKSISLPEEFTYIKHHMDFTNVGTDEIINAFSKTKEAVDYAQIDVLDALNSGLDLY